MEVTNPNVEEEDYFRKQFDDIEEFELDDEQKAIQSYQSLLQSDHSGESVYKTKELCVYKLCRLYTKSSRFDDVLGLLQNNNSFFEAIPKARTAKIVRNVIDIVATVPDSLEIQVRLCKSVIEWCKIEKRNFLRQRLEAKLSALYLEQKSPQPALALVTSLLKELRKLDDKQMLTEVHLTESRIFHSLQNIPKAKASLTACRTAANAIYVTPILQAELDEMSGVLLCEEGDNVTAYSYFLEAFEGFDQAVDRRAVRCLQYMCLSKVLNDSGAEVAAIISSRASAKVFVSRAGVVAGDLTEVEAMVAVAKAAKERSLEAFQTAVAVHSDKLRKDDLIAHHLDVLYERMLDTNLLKIIQPFSAVQVTHVAKLINLPEAQVERKLSLMILDGRFSGILDQGKGCLMVYDAPLADPSLAKSVDIITNLGAVVEALARRAKSLSKTAN